MSENYEWRFCPICHERIFKDEVEGVTILTVKGESYCLEHGLEKENDRLKEGIKFIMNECQDDEIWDYLNHLLQGTEDDAQIFRFEKEE